MSGLLLNDNYIQQSGLFHRKFIAYSAALYWKSANSSSLETSNKIVLPPSAFRELSILNMFDKLKINNPIIFEIANNSDLLPAKSHCTVIEFTANDGCAYLPIWMLNNLGLDYHGNDLIELKSTNLPKGELVQVQAHKTEFVYNMISIPKIIVEKNLNKYSCLTVGDTVKIEYNNNIYKFDVIKVKPSIIKSTAPPAISIIDIDIKIDFKEPIDYKNWKNKNNINDINHTDVNIEEKKDNDINDDDNDDDDASDDYFDFYNAYGQQSLLINSPNSSDTTVFSFSDTNKGFCFFDDNINGNGDNNNDNNDDNIPQLNQNNVDDNNDKKQNKKD